MIRYTEKDDCLIFGVGVAARVSRSEIAGELDGAQKIRLAAPPTDGAANTRLIKLLAKIFDAAKSEVEILSGETSKNKQIKIRTAKAAENLRRICGLK